MNILEEIKVEHDEARDLILKIDADTKDKKKLYGEFVVAVLAHHKAEEEVAFPALPGKKEAQELAHELTAEHDCLVRQFQVVLEADNEDDWEAAYQVAKEIFWHHIQEEENELFAQLREALEEKELTKLYKDFEKAEEAHKEKATEMLKAGLVLEPDQFVPKGKAKPAEKKASAKK